MSRRDLPNMKDRQGEREKKALFIFLLSYSNIGLTICCFIGSGSEDAWQRGQLCVFTLTTYASNDKSAI